MTTNEARQIAVKVSRGIIPYSVGCKQSAVRHSMTEFNKEYRRLVGDERYLQVREEYLEAFYHTLGLKYEGVDRNGEAVDQDEKDEIGPLKDRISRTIEEIKKSREQMEREQRRFEMKAGRCRREIVNQPIFWFNALILLVVGAAVDGVIWQVAEEFIWPLALAVLALSSGIGLGLRDYVKTRNKITELSAQETQFSQKAEKMAEQVQEKGQEALRKEAEFDLLCTLLTRSFNLDEYLNGETTKDSENNEEEDAPPNPPSDQTSDE
jgi:outer membrane murein-binding lipoprotein Lpp